MASGHGAPPGVTQCAAVEAVDSSSFGSRAAGAVRSALDGSDLPYWRATKLGGALEAHNRRARRHSWRGAPTLASRGRTDHGLGSSPPPRFRDIEPCRDRDLVASAATLVVRMTPGRWQERIRSLRTRVGETPESASCAHTRLRWISAGEAPQSPRSDSNRRHLAYKASALTR